MASCSIDYDTILCVLCEYKYCMDQYKIWLNNPLRASNKEIWLWTRQTELTFAIGSYLTEVYALANGEIISFARLEEKVL